MIRKKYAENTLKLLKSRPPTPEPIKAQLRQEGGFGCCKCGKPVYQYHHIIEYSQDHHFRAEGMMILCPYCHDEATKKAMPEKEQRKFKANPYNLERGYAGGILKLNQDDCLIHAGSVGFIATGDILRVDGEPLISLKKGITNSPEFSLKLFDCDDNLLVSVNKNEWHSDLDSSPWDIVSDFQYLKIRQKKGDIRFEMDTSQKFVQLKASLWRKGHYINIDKEKM